MTQKSLIDGGVEFSSNSNTSDADNLTAFAYGSAGSTVPGPLTANRTKRVKFLTPILSTDRLSLEVSHPATGFWVPVVHADAATGLQALMQQGTNYYGFGLEAYDASPVATEINVVFGRYGAVNGGSAYGGVGNAWATGQGNWRVKKSAN